MRYNCKRNEIQECMMETLLKNYIYKYYLIEYSAFDKYLYKIIRTYGVKIQKLTKERIEVESKTINNISINKERVKKIIRLLNRFQVTPITLEDIVVDNI